MQQMEKSECENLFFARLDADWNLPFFLVHALIGEPME
jgi:hypothetical protein